MGSLKGHCGGNAVEELGGPRRAEHEVHIFEDDRLLVDCTSTSGGRGPEPSMVEEDCMQITLSFSLMNSNHSDKTKQETDTVLLHLTNLRRGKMKLKPDL